MPASPKSGIRKCLRISMVCVAVMVLNSCDVVQQTQHMTNLITCAFRVANVQQVTLAGVSIQNVQTIKTLNATDAARIMMSLTSGSLPLSFVLNIQGKNPNATPAGMHQLDWILFIDNIQIATGSVTEHFTIPPNNGTTMIPLRISVDLRKILQGKSLDAIANFAFNLAGASNKPTRITAKIKPTILVGQTPLSYPGYITINTDFSGL